ncbi:MAG: acetyl-CoA carboxylase biotin carboxyl carrier protein [Clostridia bacterium]
MKKLDLEQIKALAEIMKENGLTSVKIKDEDEEISIERGCAQAPAPVAAAAPAAPAAAVNEAPAPSIAPAPAAVDGTPVKSPMVGVFYSAPSPEEKPYVQVGDKVKKGDVLCIVEAMKLMNEIAAETDGEIAQVCVEDGNLVEYGQTLFIIK